MLYLRHEVVKIELVLPNLLLQTLGLLFVELHLCTFNQRYHVAHTQYTVSHTFGVEHVNGLHLLASTYKLDRLCNHRAYRQGSTATGVAVEFSQHHAVKVQTVVELLSRVHGVLTRHRVYHEQRLVGLYSLLQSSNLRHHLLVNSQTACGIDDDHIIIFLLRLADGIVGYLHHVLVVGLRIYGHANRFAHHMQLLYGSRTIHVAGHQQRTLVLTLLQHLGQLTREGRLTRTLKTRHQHDGRTSLQFQLHGLATHQLGQFVVHYLHHQLAGLDGRQHIHAQSLLLYGVCKLLSYLVVHVGIQQGLANILQRLRYVYLGDFSLTLQYLERPFKSVT